MKYVILVSTVGYKSSIGIVQTLIQKVYIV